MKAAAPSCRRRHHHREIVEPVSAGSTRRGRSFGLPFCFRRCAAQVLHGWSKLLQAPSPQLLWIALRGLPGVVWGHRSDNAARWRRGLVRLATVAAMAMAAFAAKAEDAAPGTWQTLLPLQGVPYPTNDPTIWSEDRSEMKFVVARSNAPGCEPNCPEWISAEGDIAAGTPALLKRTLKKLGKSQTADYRQFLWRQRQCSARTWPDNPQEQARYRRRQDRVFRLLARDGWLWF